MINIDNFVYIMNYNVLSPLEAKQARHTLMLSQRKVANAIDMNRSTYALFEVGRYLLTENEQLTLKKHFESLDYTFPERPKEKMPPPPQYRNINGVSVPNQIKTDKANQVLAQIAKNDVFIKSKAKELTGQHWFTEEPKPEVANKIIELLAYNYCHLRWLRGLDGLLGNDYAEDMNPENTTNGAMVNQRLYR